MYTVKECVRNNATFKYYRKGFLYYECDNGFIFPIPIEDTGDGTFPVVERGMLLMRWIRRALESVE